MQYHAPVGVSIPTAPYVDANISIGLQGSVIPAAAIEYTQREIVAAITNAGLTPTDADLGQLWKAMQLSPWLQEYAIDTGSANAYSAAISSLPPMLVPGMSVRIKIANSCTNAGSTFSLNAFGTFQLVNANGSITQTGNLVSGQIAWLIFDGSRWQIANNGGGGGSGGSTTLITIPYALDTGTTNNLVGAFSPTVTVLAAGTALLIRAQHANTAAMTLTADATGSKALTTTTGGAIAGGVVQSGMILLAVYDGTEYQLIMSGGGSGGGGPSSNGACYLSLVAGNLVLLPKEGNTVCINNALQTIPPGGVVGSPAGLGVGVFNYVYVTMTASVMTLVFSSTGHATSAVSGMEIMIGDETKTLVGACFTVAGPNFVDQDGARYVLSWFKKKAKRSRTVNPALSGTGSAAFVEISTSLRNSFICWAGDLVGYNTTGEAYSTSGQDAATGINFDSASAGTVEPDGIGGGGNGGYTQSPVSLNGFKTGLSEGQHFATLMGLVYSGGGAAYWVGTSGAIPSQLQVTLLLTIQG